MPRKSVDQPVIIYEFRPRPDSPESAEDFNPFLSVWSSPRVTVRRVITENPTRHAILLSCLAGICNWFDGASKANIGDEISFVAVLLLCLIAGALNGIIGLYMFGAIGRWTGTWIRGVATAQQLRTCFAWANVTAIIGLPVWLLRLLLFGEQNFTAARPIVQTYPILAIPLVLFAIVDVGLIIWTIVAFSNMVAEVQKFESAWLGFGNLLLTGLIIALCMSPIVMIVFVISAP